MAIKGGDMVASSESDEVAALKSELEAVREALEETRAWCEGLEQRQARLAALFSVGSRLWESHV
jgi:hypothetical protein